jgi:hypothetical protein
VNLDAQIARVIWVGTLSEASVTQHRLVALKRTPRRGVPTSQSCRKAKNPVDPDVAVVLDYPNNRAVLVPSIADSVRRISMYAFSPATDEA